MRQFNAINSYLGSTSLIAGAKSFLGYFFTKSSADKTRSTSSGFTSPSFPSSVLSRVLSPMALPIPHYHDPLNLLLRKEERRCFGCKHFERIEDNEYCLKHKKASKQLFKCSNYMERTL